MSDKPKDKPKVGDTWLNSISGQEYEWTGKVWKPTGRYPYGANPMGFLGDGVFE